MSFDKSSQESSEHKDSPDYSSKSDFARKKAPRARVASIEDLDQLLEKQRSKPERLDPHKAKQVNAGYTAIIFTEASIVADYFPKPVRKGRRAVVSAFTQEREEKRRLARGDVVSGPFIRLGDVDSMSDLYDESVSGPNTRTDDDVMALSSPREDVGNPQHNRTPSNSTGKSAGAALEGGPSTPDADAEARLEKSYSEKIGVAEFHSQIQALHRDGGKNWLSILSEFQKGLQREHSVASVN